MHMLGHIKFPPKEFLNVAKNTVMEIDKIFFSKNEGYLDSIPIFDNIRRQNPHMHLLEAYLILFEVSKDVFYLDYARHMVNLALKHFIVPETGMLLEFFDINWKPLYTPGYNRVEPGHLFEWAWLFSEFLRLSDGTFNNNNILHIEKNLFNTAISYGVNQDSLVVYDAITEHGKRLENSTRIWPQTEFMRMLALWRGKNRNEYSQLLVKKSKHFLKHIYQKN